MKRSGMPFGLFKGLVNDSYEAARKILSPPLLARAKSATFDFQIARPQFSSLVIALEAPLINEKNVKRIMKKPGLSRSNIVNQIDNTRATFFEDMNELVSIADKGKISESFAADQFYLLDSVRDIIPNSDNKIDSLELNANISDDNNFIFVDENVGDAITNAHREANASTN